MRTLQFCNLVFSAVRNSDLWACSASLRGGTQCQPAPSYQSPITLWVLVSELTWKSCPVPSPAESLDSGCRLLHSCLPWSPNQSSLILFNTLEAHYGVIWEVPLVTTSTLKSSTENLVSLFSVLRFKKK